MSEPESTPSNAASQDTAEEVQLTPAQKRRFALLAAILALILVTAVGEIAVRLLLRYNTPDTIRENSLQYRPSTFTRHLLAPNQEIDRGKAWGDTSASDASEALTYTINRHGYRGAEWPTQKPQGSCRLAVLGGSAVFDLGAAEGVDWPHQVQELLRPRASELGIGLEVINAGVPGHTSADAVGKLYADLWRFEPDAVLLYNAWNDIKTFTSLTPSMPLPDLVQPHDPKADPFQNYAGPVDRLLGHSQLYIKLRNRYLLWRYPLGLEGQVADDQLRDRFDPWALRQYRLNVELVVDGARNLGSQPILLTQATLVTPTTTDEDRERIAYGYQGLQHDALVQAVQSCNDTVRQVAAAKETPLLDLDARFSGRSELFDDHVHTSRLGSQALATAVAEFLESKLGGICGVDQFDNDASSAAAPSAASPDASSSSTGGNSSAPASQAGP